MYFVKLPYQWLNLAQIRQVKPGDQPGKIVVIWDTGEFDIFVGNNAMAILEALAQTNHIDKSNIGSASA